MNSIEDLLSLFVDVQQQSKHNHKTLHRKLHLYFHQLSTSQQDEVIHLLLGSVLDRSLLVPKTSTYVDRVLDFLALFFAQATTSEEHHILLIEHLKNRINSSNKLVRQRCCDFLTTFLANVTDLSTEIFQQLSQLVTIRLKDKIAVVRLAAVNALQYLQDPEDSQDISTQALLSTMTMDPNATVRKAIVDHIVLTETTKMALAQRIRDVKAEVRRAVIVRLTEATDVRQFSRDLRFLIIKNGLQDRDQEVQSLTEKLILKWLSLLHNDIVRFLAYFHSPEDSFEDCLQLVGAVLAEKCLQPSTGSLNETETASVQAIRSQTPAWGKWRSGYGLDSSMTGDLQWTSLRLSYAQAYMNTFSFTNLAEELLPDVTIFIQVVHLVDSKIAQTTENSEEVLRIYRALAKLAPMMVAVGDVTSHRALEILLLDQLQHPHLQCAQTVDLLLRAWQAIHLPVLPNRAAPTPTAIRKFVEEIEKLIMRLYEQYNANAQAEGDLDTGIEVMQILLQVILWTLKNPSVNEALVQRGCSPSMNESPASPKLSHLLLQALQSGDVEQRELAMICLGTFCLLAYQLYGEDQGEINMYLHIIKRIACTSGMESPTSVVDKKDVTILLHSVLHAGMDGSGEAFFVAALEAAVKLTFNGYLTAPEVVYEILATFFFQQDERMSQVQQLVSLFLTTYLTSPGSSSVVSKEAQQGNLSPCVEVICESMSLFLSHVTTQIRDQVLSVSALQPLLHNLLGVLVAAASPVSSSYNADLEVAKYSLEIAIFGNLCREMLKLNMVDKTDRLIFQHYSKVVCQLDIFANMSAEEQGTAQKIMRALYEQAEASVKSTAKPTVAFTSVVKGYQDWLRSNHSNQSDNQVQAYQGRERLLCWASGLSDLLQLAQPYWDEPSFFVEADEDHPRTRASRAASNTQSKAQPKKKAAAKITIDSDDEEEEDSDDYDSEEDGASTVANSDDDKETSSVDTDKDEESVANALKLESLTVSDETAELGKSSRRAMLAGTY
eukprot:gene6543-7217_t